MTSPSSFLEIPSDDVLTNCMHCGLCLPVCPTYEVSGLERSSPRGRIRLIKKALTDPAGLSKEFADEMNFCLDCQACESACPAGVQYGSLVVAARSLLVEKEVESRLSRFLKRFFLGNVFGSRRKLSLLAHLLRAYQASGLSWYVESSGILELLSPTLRKIHPLTPVISSSFSSQTMPDMLPAFGRRLYSVGFLTGCIMDVSFAAINEQTVNLLRSAGCDVHIPPGQACCGSLAAHYGESRSARRLASETVKHFQSLEVDYVVHNSAGCGAFMKEYSHVFDGDSDLGSAAKSLSGKTLDITEFLVLIGWTPKGAPGGRRLTVTYHDACHLAHSQKIVKEPRDLLRSLPGVDFAELPDASWCCGSAGIYNVVRYDDAMKFLERKIRTIESVAPDVIVTGNPGCMIQIAHGLKQHGIDAEVVHTASFLNRYA